jgi:hypothetical protein
MEEEGDRESMCERVSACVRERESARTSCCVVAHVWAGGQIAARERRAGRRRPQAARRAQPRAVEPFARAAVYFIRDFSIFFTQNKQSAIEIISPPVARRALRVECLRAADPRALRALLRGHRRAGDYASSDHASSDHGSSDVIIPARCPVCVDKCQLGIESASIPTAQRGCAAANGSNKQHHACDTKLA